MLASGVPAVFLLSILMPPPSSYYFDLANLPVIHYSFNKRKFTWFLKWRDERGILGLLLPAGVSDGVAQEVASTCSVLHNGESVFSSDPNQPQPGSYLSHQENEIQLLSPECSRSDRTKHRGNRQEELGEGEQPGGCLETGWGTSWGSGLSWLYLEIFLRAWDGGWGTWAGPSK